MSQYPEDPDGEALELLAAQGVDMSQPIRIEFTVAAPDEVSAQSIEAALIEAGYDAVAEYDDGEPFDDEHECDESCDHAEEFDEAVDLESSDDSAEVEESDETEVEGEDWDGEEEFAPGWTVFVSVVMVPEYDGVVRVQKELDQHVRDMGGVVDGWGVMVGDDPQ